MEELIKADDQVKNPCVGMVLIGESTSQQISYPMKNGVDSQIEKSLLQWHNDQSRDKQRYTIGIHMNGKPFETTRFLSRHLIGLQRIVTYPVSKQHENSALHTTMNVQSRCPTVQ